MSRARRQTPSSPAPLSPAPRKRSLNKQRSWTHPDPDVAREAAWLRRSQTLGRQRSMSNLTDDDVDELKACMELGFGFDHPDPRLSETIPALELYYAINNNQYSKSLSRTSSSSSCSMDSGTDTSCPSPLLNNAGGDQETKNTWIRQWAQVIGCSVRQKLHSSSSYSSSPPSD